MDKVQEEKIPSVDFSHAVLSLLSTRDDLAAQALIWLRMVWFTVIHFVVVWFSTSYANVR
jgi:hypothetical protein